MSDQCGCAYNEVTHPDCDRMDVSCLVTFWDDQDVLMCRWCAGYWDRPGDITVTYPESLTSPAT